ncbi:hypothetical protein [Streptomyces sp. KR80]|jgi:hypothetical protein|uniref:hypothetical protein n=1 Tax=Streptomyces sp. KR80 TaxID=3457426 RepID=UPI003FCFBD5A
MTTLQHSAHVSVHLTDCAARDADAVFGVLRAAFPADINAETREHRQRPPEVANPMVWIETYDVRTPGETREPTVLEGAVTADLFGCHRPVRQIEEALARSFRVEEEGHVVPGDQEVQVRLRLSHRATVPS